jgi:uncharacterized BrkB/YihY/UPF0761 family membrane protein
LSSSSFGAAWKGVLLAAGPFVAIAGLFSYLLPAINEVPAGFPADVLWRFRLSSWALQLVLWTAIGLLFGWLTDRDARWSRAIN